MENLEMEDLVLEVDVPHLSVGALISTMGMPELASHFEANVSMATLLNLAATDIPVILPRPSFHMGNQLMFMQKYSTFMTSNGLELHPTFKGHIATAESETPKAIADKDVNGNVSARNDTTKDTITSVGALPSPISQAKEVNTPKNDDGNPIASGSEFDPHSYTSDSTSQDSDSEPLMNLRKRSKIGEGSSKVRGEEANQSSVSFDKPKPPKSSEPESASSGSPSLPLVNPSKLGSKRRTAKSTESEIDMLDLEDLFEDHPLCSAILLDYGKKKYLSNEDRGILSAVLVPWLLKKTNYPRKEHYEALTTKICSLFPTEKDTVWYKPPFTDSKNQKNAMGRLPDKIKNSKTKLRKKGKLPKSANRSKRILLEVPLPQVDYSVEEQSSITWLERNHEPMSEVRFHWRRSAKPRIKQLLQDTNMTPHSYVNKWHDILQFPDSHQLVLDDFEIFPDIDQKYETLRGKSENLVRNWPDFSKRVLSLIRCDRSGLSAKEKKAFNEQYKKAVDENNKDYLLLQVLPLLCKRRGRVKVGNITLKPSVADSKDAFILHVTDAARFDTTIKERHERALKCGLPVQPCIIVLGPTDDVAVAAYVIVNKVPWKASSILSAVDICMKTCFSLNCSYPPEAMHLWLLIQKDVYKVSLDEDPSVSSVVTFIEDLSGEAV